MTKSTLYKKGEFIDVEDPIEWEKGMELNENLEKEGYRRGLILGNEDFPHIQIWEADIFRPEIELMYPFYALIEIGSLNGRDLFFETYWDVLHFLENYTTWAKNLDQIYNFQTLRT